MRTLKLLLAACVLTLAACGGTEANEAQSLPTRTLDLAQDGRVLPVQVEMAMTPQEHAVGLMFRPRLDDGKGMLFVWDAPGRHDFWMKNTLIPLDMVFVRDGVVVGVVANAKPMDETTLDAGVDSDMVLEVPGGWMARNGLGVGARIDLRK